MRTAVAILLAAAGPELFAQSSLPLAGCEARPEVRRVIDEKLDRKVLDNMKFADRMGFEYRTLEELIAQYPREVEPYRQMIQTARYEDPVQYTALTARFVKQAEQHPDDPLALYLAGVVLNGRDTPRSIQLLEEAHAKAPYFAWPLLSLAQVHASGKLVDKKKAAAEAAEFFGRCPSSTDPAAQRVLNRIADTALQAKVAAALRVRLANETDPHRLQEFATLWGLEFRSRPPQEHDTLRKQVAADLKRLESMNPKPDAEWLAFLKDGYKQSGASEETVKAMEDRLMQAFPHSEQAFGIAYQRWKKGNKEPEDQSDTAAWKKWQADYYATVKNWVAQFTEDRFLQHQEWFFILYDDPDISETEGLRVVEDYLTEGITYQRPRSGTYEDAADFLVQHKWEAGRALELARQAEKLVAVDREIERDDDLSADDAKSQKEQDDYAANELTGVILHAAKLAGKPDEAERIKAAVETPPLDDFKAMSGYWLNRGRLAAIEGRKTDALTFYQQALYTRRRTPQPYHGRLQDDLLDEARAIWKDTGGTEVAWTVWKTLPAAKAQELAEGRWEKPTKVLPAFELADLTGKTWRLKSLEGKSLLVNLWATWCGPCQAELPHLEKLYEKVKDRSDIQILTFNMDQDLGLVAPFVKEKGFTFPVLPAFGFAMSLFDSGWGIPQNWIVDPKGAWRWTQLGFDASDPKWADTVIGKLQQVRTE